MTEVFIVSIKYVLVVVTYQAFRVVPCRGKACTHHNLRERVANHKEFDALDLWFVVFAVVATLGLAACGVPVH